ncbi:MAG: hypothetical protein JRI75_06225 [Deltaproteobacteria bacterium]|nr:hypothetical protein [Deltaproteobacteria bacterium]
MKQYGFSVIICIFIMLCGCSSKESNVFYVMFKGKPEITNSAVFFNGAEMGKIVSQKSGFGNICEVNITINSEHLKNMKDNVVFCVSNGRLEYHPFTGGGALLAKEAPVPGFSSNLSLSWFKAKNTLNNLPMEASKTARELHEKIRWAELKEAP